MISCYECTNLACVVSDAVRTIMKQLYANKMFKKGDKVQKCFSHIYIDCKIRNSK